MAGPAARGVSEKGGVLDWLVLPREAGMLRLN